MYINTIKLLTDSCQNSHKHAQKTQPINTTGHLFSYRNRTLFTISFIHISRYNLEDICRDTNMNWSLWRLWSSTLQLPFKLWPHLWYTVFCRSAWFHTGNHFFFPVPFIHSDVLHLSSCMFILSFISKSLKVFIRTERNKGLWNPRTWNSRMLALKEV